MGENRLFEVAEARALMPEVRSRVSAFVEARADLMELSADLRQGGSSPLGGVAEMKALQARLDEMLEWFSERGIEVKGHAPFLVDFPAELDGVSVRLCWLEGEAELRWYHRSDLGIAGRRPLPGSPSSQPGSPRIAATGAVAGADGSATAGRGRMDRRDAAIAGVVALVTAASWTASIVYDTGQREAASYSDGQRWAQRNQPTPSECETRTLRIAGPDTVGVPWLAGCLAALDR